MSARAHLHVEAAGRGRVIIEVHPDEATLELPHFHVVIGLISDRPDGQQHAQHAAAIPMLPAEGESLDDHKHRVSEAVLDAVETWLIEQRGMLSTSVAGNE